MVDLTNITSLVYHQAVKGTSEKLKEQLETIKKTKIEKLMWSKIDKNSSI